jgi:hypothetical protein
VITGEDHRRNKKGERRRENFSFANVTGAPRIPCSQSVKPREEYGKEISPFSVLLFFLLL